MRPPGVSDGGGDSSFGFYVRSEYEYEYEDEDDYVHEDGYAHEHASAFALCEYLPRGDGAQASWRNH
jgi:hypothetical protein